MKLTDAYGNTVYITKTTNEPYFPHMPVAGTQALCATIDGPVTVTGKNKRGLIPIIDKNGDAFVARLWALRPIINR